MSGSEVPPGLPTVLHPASSVTRQKEIIIRKITCVYPIVPACYPSIISLQTGLFAGYR